MAEEQKPATPVADNNGGNTPTPAPATPGENGEKVTLTKEEYDQMSRDAARAKTNQSKADRFDRLYGKAGVFGNRPQPSAQQPTAEERAEQAAEEDKKAERGILAIAANPDYREILDADPTLRNLMLTNPLAVLPMYANDALDAEDAISMVKEALNSLKKPTTPSTPPNPPANNPVPPTPPAGGINPTGEKSVDEDYENARKNPNTEQALAGMIKAGIKKMGGK